MDMTSGTITNIQNICKKPQIYKNLLSILKNKVENGLESPDISFRSKADLDRKIGYLEKLKIFGDKGKKKDNIIMSLMGLSQTLLDVGQ